MQYKRHCLECNEAFIGRCDKKFCSDQCRNNYNNHLYSGELKLIRNTNRILKKNRRILLDLSKGEKVLISRILLSEKGFDFRYFTSLLKTKGGQEFYQCYEMAFVPDGPYNYYVIKLKSGQSLIDEVGAVTQPFELQ